MKIDFDRFIRDTEFIWHPFVERQLPNYDRWKEADEVVDSGKLVANPYVSIVILSYNHKKMLRECVDSVLMQRTQFPFEIIIADDCSPDRETNEICREVQRLRPDVIRVLFGKVNVGSMRNALRGLVRCRGKYIACIDGDDFYLSPLKIQIQVKYLEEHKNVAACFSSFLQQLNNWAFSRTPIRYKTKKLYVGLNASSKEDRANLILRRNRLAPICAFFRADSAKFATQKIIDLFKIIKWFPCQDFELWYYMAFTGKIHFIPEDLCVYRANKTSASLNPDKSIANARLFGDACNKLAMIQDAPFFITDDSKDFVEKLVVYRLVQYLKTDDYANRLSEYLKTVLSQFGYSWLDLHNSSKKRSFKWWSENLRLRETMLGYLIRKCLIKVFRI